MIFLVEPPRLRAPRRRRVVDNALSTPRRSGRLATMALFGGPLSESKREAIRMLFPAGCAIDSIQLVEGVELEV